MSAMISHDHDPVPVEEVESTAHLLETLSLSQSQPQPEKKSGETETETEAEKESNRTDDDALPLLIDTVDLSIQVCRVLQHERMLSVDLEGVNLGRDGVISILQIATRSPVTITLPTSFPSSVEEEEKKQKAETDEEKGEEKMKTLTKTVTTKVFLFDITTLQSKAFQEGKLQYTILENAAVVKLFYDLRKDVDALFHQFQVRVKNVVDLQILYFETFTKHSTRPSSSSGSSSRRTGSDGSGRGRGGGSHHHKGRGAGSGGRSNTTTGSGGSKGRGSSSSGGRRDNNTSNSNTPSIKRVSGLKKALERVMLRSPSVSLASFSTSTKEESERSTTSSVSSTMTTTAATTPTPLSPTEVEFQAMEEVKARGLQLFSPELGGSYEVWQIRPLHPDLIVYCKNDVVKLFDMYDSWCSSSLPLKQLHEYSDNRLNSTIDRKIQWEGKDERWTIPDWYVMTTDT